MQNRDEKKFGAFILCGGFSSFPTHLHPRGLKSSDVSRQVKTSHMGASANRAIALFFFSRLAIFSRFQNVIAVPSRWTSEVALTFLTFMTKADKMCVQQHYLTQFKPVSLLTITK